MTIGLCADGLHLSQVHVLASVSFSNVDISDMTLIKLLTFLALTSCFRYWDFGSGNFGIVAISPHRFNNSGFLIICASGSPEHFSFLILIPRVENSGSSGESKSSVKDRGRFCENDVFYVFQAAAMSSKIHLMSVYNMYSNNIKLPLNN